MNRFCIPQFSQLPIELDTDKYNNLIGHFGLDDAQEIGEDIIQSRWLFIYTLISCLAILLAYSILIYYLPKPFIWITIITTGVGIVGLSYILNHYVNIKYSGIESYLENLQSEEPNYMALTMKSSVAVLWLFAAIYFTCVFCYI